MGQGQTDIFRQHLLHWYAKFGSRLGLSAAITANQKLRRLLKNGRGIYVYGSPHQISAHLIFQVKGDRLHEISTFISRNPRDRRVAYFDVLASLILRGRNAPNIKSVQLRNPQESDTADLLEAMAGREEDLQIRVSKESALIEFLQ